LLESADPQEAVEKLVKVANRAGGIDNITAVILDFSEDGSGPGETKQTAIPQQPTMERPVPEPPPEASTARGPRTPSRAARPAPGARPGAPRRSSRRVGRKVGIWAGVTLAVVALGMVGLRLYLDTQWFVGVSNGRVAIFRGVPTEVGGFELHSVVVETSIPAEEAQALALYRDLPDGITADDRTGAETIVESIRDDVARFEQPRS
jgi:protein phosphatase